MSDYQLSKPVAFMIFNRPDCTERVFNEIQRARPPRLLVIADGPRLDVASDQVNCRTARSIIDRVNWPCEVLTNYSHVNLGCKHRIASGLDWVFDQVEEAIILEDDCLPHPTFFRFCETLLDQFKNDERIMMISGNNFQFGKKRSSYSYYYSRFNHIWGWASWRRSWMKYDAAITLWPEIRDNGWLKKLLVDRTAAAYWTTIFDKVYTGKIDTWDYQLVFASWINNSLTILPSDNLVTNIGHGLGSTHTHATASKYSNVPSIEMRFPLRHPPFIIRDSTADDHEQYDGTSIRPLPVRTYKGLIKMISHLTRSSHNCF